MTSQIDEILVGRNASHPLSITHGYEWYDTIYSIDYLLHDTGAAALLVDVQNISPRLKAGEVVADLVEMAAHGHNIDETAYAAFNKNLLDTIFKALPGHYLYETAEDEAPLDLSLMLNVYGLVSDGLPAARRAHLHDADVQAGKQASFGLDRSIDRRIVHFGLRQSAASIFAEKVRDAVRSVKGAFNNNEEDIGVSIEDVAVAALSTVKRYTDMVEAGDLAISNDRGVSIFRTMSQIKVCLDVYCPEDYRSDAHSAALRDFDDTMIQFQQAVVARLPTPDAPRPVVGM